MPAAETLSNAPTRDRRLWLILAAYWLLLLAGTHVPGAPVPSGPAAPDKLIHLGAYATLGCLLAVCVTPRGGRLSALTASVLGLVLIAYGAVDELTQPYFSRACDLYDWFADVAGVMIGVGAYAVWTRFR